MGLGKILIRADSSAEIGTGHVMRCLALAQAWHDAGGQAFFFMAESTPAVIARLAAEGIAVSSLQAAVGSTKDLNDTAEIAAAQNANWIVLDGYRFGTDYCRRLDAAGTKLLYIDDNAEIACSPDILLNQNLQACESLYKNRGGACRVLLGPTYALLRREFREWKNRCRRIPDRARGVLITMGGSDPQNLTVRVLRALALVGKEMETRVVVGGSNPRITELRALADSSSPAVHVVVNANNMPELMAKADMAVSAAGTTCWEMCMLGLPAIVIDTTPNEQLLAEELARREIVHHVAISQADEHELARTIQTLAKSAPLRTGMAQRSAELVDGQGAARVVAAMTGLEMHNLPAPTMSFI